MGMEETITNTDCNMPFLCYFCGREPENAIMLRGAAEAILDMFHALSYADDDQKEVVNGVKEAFEEAAFLHRLCDRGSCKGVRCRREALSGGLAVRPKDQGEEE